MPVPPPRLDVVAARLAGERVPWPRAVRAAARVRERLREALAPLAGRPADRDTVELAVERLHEILHREFGGWHPDAVPALRIFFRADDPSWADVAVDEYDPWTGPVSVELLQPRPPVGGPPTP